MVTVARMMETLACFTKREPWYPLNLYPYIFYDWPVSSEKARRELGFHPTPFEDGAHETLEWYRANGIPHRLLRSKDRPSDTSFRKFDILGLDKQIK
jgi:hypothetical protein